MSARTRLLTGARGRSAVGIALCATLVLAASCSSDEPSALGESTEPASEELGDPVHGGELTVGLEAETNSWLPGEGGFAPASFMVAYSIYDPLMAPSGDGGFRPFLAESLEPDESLTEWTLTLRPGVRFHDGTPLDAATLQANFDEYLTVPDAKTAGALANVEELRVDGELTATYRLREPNASFPEALTEAAGMPFSIEAARAAGADAGARPVGTGPFRFESWNPDDRLVVTRNDDYWRDGLPYLDRITFRPIPDERIRVQSLLTGGIDAIQTLRGSSIKELQAAEDEGFVAHVTINDDAGVSVINTLEPPFDDVRVRRAYAHTVDPDAVAQILGDDGLVEPASQFVSSDSPWYSEEVAAAKPPFDLDAARTLVAEYVSDPERSDGKMVGEPPTLRYGCVDDPILSEVSLLAKQRGEAAGFAVRLENRDQAAHVVATEGGADDDPPFSGDFGVNCYRVIPAGGLISTLASAFGPPETTALNHTNYRTPELAALLEELQSTVDFEEQRRLVERIGLIINEQVPLTYGTGTPAAIGVRDAVRNITGWTLPDRSTGTGASRAVTRWSEVWLVDEG